jgi:hypothetical protein
VLEVYGLTVDGYQKLNNSQIPVLAAIDLSVLADCILIGETSRIKAVSKFLGK